MKTKPILSVLAPVLQALLLTINSPLSTAHAQGTAFTYQGVLQSGGSPANGFYDMSFSLYETNSGGSAVAGPNLLTAVGVTNGLFMVDVQFYEIWVNAQIYETFWLDVSVRPSGNGSFTELAPRQLVSPSPFAVYSEFANNANNVPANSISAQDLRTAVAPNYGQVLQFGSSGELTWTNLPSGGGGGSGGWSLTGNAGTSPADGNFVGTTDDNPLALEVNGQRALLLVPTTEFEVLDAPNLIGGSSGNTVTGVGGTIAGGGAVNYYTYNTPENTVSGDFGTIAGGAGNAASFAGAVGGGFYNTANANFAIVGGGYNNSASGAGAFVGGGGYDGGGYGGNQATGGASVVVGGIASVANGAGSFIGGGGYEGTTVRGNTNTGPVATIAGGLGNNIGGFGDFAFIGGGVNNTASYENETVSGGADNIAGDEGATVAGGENNNAIGEYAFVGGGYDNTATNEGATVGGGYQNTASGSLSTVGGGDGNIASAEYSTVGGGYFNSATASYATVVGGIANAASGAASFAAGQYATASDDDSFVWGTALARPNLKVQIHLLFWPPAAFIFLPAPTRTALSWRRMTQPGEVSPTATPRRISRMWTPSPFSTNWPPFRSSNDSINGRTIPTLRTSARWPRILSAHFIRGAIIRTLPPCNSTA